MEQRYYSKILVVLVLCVVAHRVQAQSLEARISNLPQAHKAWVNRACPKTLGPFLWSRCVTREADALSRGLPDISHMKPANREWLQRSCPGSLPPSLAINCLNREIQALDAGLPDISTLPSEKRARIQQVCPQVLPPSLYRSCVNREMGAAVGSVKPLTVPPMSPHLPRASPAPPLPPSSVPSGSADIYEIEVSHDDEFFIINGEKFEARTYCFNMEEGDAVIFLEGSALGVCVTATILNLRTRKTCDLWCE